MTEITSYEQFKEVVNSSTPVIVKFGAPWCAPCKAIEPNLEQVAADGFDVYKINVDNIAEAAIDWAVMSVPTTFGFKGGKGLGRDKGILTVEEIKALVSNA